MSEQNREEEASIARETRQFGCIVFSLFTILILTVLAAAYLGGCFR